MIAYTGKDWSKGNTHPLLVGVQTCTTTLENHMAATQNWKPTYLKTQQYHSWVHTQRMHTHTTVHLLNHVHSNIIHNSQNLETT